MPNWIGYFRFFALLYAMKFAWDPSTWFQFAVWYSISQLLDMFDGMAARALNQCSRFGALLDMICDRAACSSIYMILMQVHPETWKSYCFLVCFFLDFGSHYLQFCSTALAGAASHKG